MKTPEQQAIEVGAEMLDLFGTKQVRRFEILDRRFQRLVKALKSVESIDRVLGTLQDRYPQHVGEGKALGVRIPYRQED